MGTAQQVLDIARSQIGYKESPAGSNKTKYGQAFGLNNAPWCAIFVWYCCTQAGVTLPTKTAGVYALMDAFGKQGRFYDRPQPGDIAIFSYGDGHCEFVEQVPLTGRSLVDIGGNTSSGDGSPNNGGAVARKTRPWSSQVLGFCRPIYSNTPAQPVPAPQENDDMIQYEWPDGAVVCVDPEGNAYCPSYPGRPTARHYKGIPQLRDDAKRAFGGKVVSVVGVNRNDSQAGYIMCDESWGANGEFYKFDPSVGQYLK